MLVRWCSIAVALSALVPAAALAQHKGDFPVKYVDRPLTLPKKMLSPEFHVGVDHFEPEGINGTAINSVPIDAGLSYGVIDDVTLYTQPLTLLIGRTDVTVFGVNNHTTHVYYGLFRLGGTFRFFHNDVVEIGGRAEFGASGALDMLHLTGGIPLVVHAGHVVRFETGFFVSGFFPVGNAGQYLLFPHGSKADGGIATMSGSLGNLVPIPGPGIPLNLTVQLAEPVFLGLDTGFGLGSFHTTNSDDAAFAPLGFHLGGTISSHAKPVADIVGKFSFPAFLVGTDDDPPQPNLWELGLTADLFLPL
ncbi:MAG: hypothetical protein U0414_13500 [Polyangiaceae bacterium]